MTARTRATRIAGGGNRVHRHMRRLAKWMAGLVVLVAGGVAVVVAMENRAAGKAMAFCDRFKPGTAFLEAGQAARAEIDRQFVTLSDDELTVSFYGAIPPSLHLCTVKARDGKVTLARYSHVD